MAEVRFGHYSNEPCRVCDGHDDNQIEPRFSYTVCWVHQRVPPAYLNRARAQFQETGSTQWDRQPGDSIN